uniref:Uncharacterized protein n=1 Tax=Mycena chlorophos TaxID=658473 RepID=A0ABQ0L5C0_MYCCL|nr:predicted protein [Mycena chlorophos]
MTRLDYGLDEGESSLLDSGELYSQPSRHCRLQLWLSSSSRKVRQHPSWRAQTTHARNAFLAASAALDPMRRCEPLRSDSPAPTT